MRKQHEDQYYLEGLLSNDSSVIQKIYSRFSSKVKRLIVSNSGTEDDAGDIFQESLIDIYNQAKYKGLQLTCPFEPFFLMVCKRKWLNQLKKKSNLQVTNNEDDLLSIGEDVFLQADKLLEEEEQSKLYVKMFERLSEKCREIINLTLIDEHQERIAEKLNVTYGYLRKKKSECVGSLMQMIKSEIRKRDEQV
ncbi:RNA polymerase, sigma-24 subunit, ECF subfamily [Pseudopedobacter saltans DSM 12145]|uniref:RNA polymerase, sigma-24 subunit, ECF subfamily n=1 Tax=Pseudopedobacter saltans (strain ATCC 51119 / DSM 12145 / JCM 21818 / CCUG 39354 / LMG 10337 / NBRC 100064 / NCIMB 13643) TaxID=762903 RepID=F0S5T9_PSESL|nr:sigma-70 family RNA polymerase sigma factor [Pseudopedobacter saltans]ADY51010.1 RNA polymerase, sigma-24 subunit, ECF subfamily [Pseudopedobacter saltans DSM 12145]